LLNCWAVRYWNPRRRQAMLVAARRVPTTVAVMGNLRLEADEIIRVTLDSTPPSSRNYTQRTFSGSERSGIRAFTWSNISEQGTNN
jgi:NADH:ubiquinone oxidoreductase subunit H